MQIVIDIPEHYYENNIKKELPIYLTEKQVVAIFPKGHGRLIEADAFEKDMINGIKAGNYEDGYDNYSHINNIDDCVECVKYADTIIEADKEE